MSHAPPSHTHAARTGAARTGADRTGAAHTGAIRTGADRTPRRTAREVVPARGPAIASERAVDPLLAENKRWLWGLCYRMTGSSADADDLVQETFLRAMERPPARTDEPIGPWLLRVAVNLGRDALRRRKRRRYTGPWLPAAVEEEEIAVPEIAGAGGTEGRYDLLESVSFAFLLALEVLTPNQRAVLVLRDVLDRSVRETAEALGLSEGNVKVLHHRARHALEPYEARRAETRPSEVNTRRAGEALQRFLVALAAGDEAAVMSSLAGDAEAWSDGGGQFLASRVVIAGAARVARMFVGITRKSPPLERYELRTINGAAALVGERTVHRPTDAPRFVLACDVNAEGKITRIYSVLATPKLSHVRPVAT